MIMLIIDAMQSNIPSSLDQVKAAKSKKRRTQSTSKPATQSTSKALTQSTSKKVSFGDVQ